MTVAGGSAAQLPVQPEDCQLFCSLPLTLEAFVEDARRGPADRFAPSSMIDAFPQSSDAGWSCTQLQQRWQDLAAPKTGDLWFLAEALKAMAVREEDESSASVPERGVEVHSTTLSDEFIAAPKSRVVTVTAHWADDRVEFRDGLVPVDRLANAFDRDYDGTIDLTCCSCASWHDAIRARCGSGPRIIWSRYETYLGLRIATYRLALRLLRLGEWSFVDAYAEAWARIWESSE